MVIPPALARRLNREPVAHFATAAEAAVGLVPICFVLLGSTVYHALDSKPKSVPLSRLRRVRHIRASPPAAALVDHYEEDWTRLWYALLEGEARFLASGVEHRRAVRALRRKYAQYRAMPLLEDAPVIALAIRRVRYWQAKPDGRSPARPPAKGARRSAPRGSRSRGRRSAPRS